MNRKLRTDLKDIEVRVLVELMKNSRSSDREISKALRVSQPTVSRTRTRLERDRIIREYTVIPDFVKLGYNIMAVAFLGKQEGPTKEESEELRRAAVELEKRTPYASLIVVNGIGLKKGRMLINLYKDYADYLEGLSTIRSLPNVQAENLEGFLVDLNDERNFRVLSLKQVARHFQTLAEAAKREQKLQPKT